MELTARASIDLAYVMQAYAQIVDKTLTYDDLPALGAKLKLPSGWRYSTTVPQQDIVAGAEGKSDRGAGRSRQHLSEAGLTSVKLTIRVSK